MPKNKFQRFIFGIIMSYAMAYGMEVYNIAIKEGVNLTVGGLSNMTNAVFFRRTKRSSLYGIICYSVFKFMGEPNWKCNRLKTLQSRTR